MIVVLARKHMVQKELKYWVIVVLIFSTALISSCSHLPTWAADPLNFDVRPAQAPLGSNISVDVYQWDLIYVEGFVWNSVNQYWEPFSLINAQTQGNWTPISVQQTVFLDPVQFVLGENYVAVWACNIDSARADGWDCNDYPNNDTGRWMLARFEVLAPRVQISLPNISSTSPLVLNVSRTNITVATITNTNQTSAPINTTNASVNISTVLTNISVNVSLNATTSVAQNTTSNVVMNVSRNVTAGLVTNVSGGVSVNITTTTVSLPNLTVAMNVSGNATVGGVVSNTTAITLGGNQTVNATTTTSPSTGVSSGASSGGASSGGGGGGSGGASSGSSGPSVIVASDAPVAPSRESGTFRSLVKDTFIENILFDKNETRVVENEAVVDEVRQPSLQAPVETKKIIRWWYGPLFVLFDVLVN